jgi:hypothetical protein
MLWLLASYRWTRFSWSWIASRWDRTIVFEPAERIRIRIGDGTQP